LIVFFESKSLVPTAINHTNEKVFHGLNRHAMPLECTVSAMVRQYDLCATVHEQVLKLDGGPWSDLVVTGLT
jgi:hypothetical protein